MKLMLFILGAVGLIAFVIIHIVWYIKPSHIRTVEGFDRELTNGTPTIIEYYSNL